MYLQTKHLMQCVVWQAHIEGLVKDPTLGTKVEKSVFVVFFAGERARSKILKLCEAVGASRYPFPEDRARQRQMNAEVCVSC